MSTLRVLGTSTEMGRHDGDVFACAFTPDSAFVLSAGWDGVLKLWDVQTATVAAELRTGPRPLSACAVAPDGKHWLSGSMDGMLGQWDADTQAQVSLSLAHTRPVACLRYSPDGTQLATSSWDRNVNLWPTERLGQGGKTLGSHGDIAAGCRFTPDGRRLVSWSYDGKACVWDLIRGQRQFELQGHGDRITAGGVAPDARWFASGSRDGQVKLWDLQSGREVSGASLGEEVRGCLFLLDAETLVIVDAGGRLGLYQLPSLQPFFEVCAGSAVQCAELAPSGGMIALGCGDGRVSLVAVEGFDSAPLAVTAKRSFRDGAGVFRRLLGGSRPTPVYLCTCPACRQSFELPGTAPEQPTPCPGCRRRVRACLVTQAETTASR